MRKSMIAGILMGIAAGSPVFAQGSAEDVTQLKQRVAQLERQVQEMSQLLEPLKAQQAVDKRQKSFRDKFNLKMAQDRAKYSQEQLRDAEQLYQVANQKWGTPEANASLQQMMKKYPDINRTGCATLYVAQKSEGEERARYLKVCIEKYNDCFYGDGVQVGAYARFLLAGDYKRNGDTEKAAKLLSELKINYPDAIDHSGNLLAGSIEAEAN
jgi:hypothetical protein